MVTKFSTIITTFENDQFVDMLINIFLTHQVINKLHFEYWHNLKTSLIKLVDNIALTGILLLQRLVNPDFQSSNKIYV